MVESVTDAAYLENAGNGLYEMEAAGYILAEAGIETTEPSAEIDGDSFREYDGPEVIMSAAPEEVEEDKPIRDREASVELVYDHKQDAVEVRAENISFATPTGRLDSSRDEIVEALVERVEPEYDPEADSYNTKEAFLRQQGWDVDSLVKTKEEITDKVEPVKDYLTTREDIPEGKALEEDVREEFEEDGVFETAAVLEGDRIAAEVERYLMDRGMDVLVGTTHEREQEEVLAESTSPRNTLIGAAEESGADIEGLFYAVSDNF